MRPTRYAYVAGVLFAAEAAFAIGHRLGHCEYTGFTHTHDVVIDVGLAIVWSASALACLFHRTWPAFMVALVGSCVSLIHGVMFSLASGELGPRGVGVPFLVAAGIQLYCAALDAPAFLAARPHAEGEPRRRLAWLPRLRQAH